MLKEKEPATATVLIQRGNSFSMWVCPLHVFDTDVVLNKLGEAAMI